MINKFKIPTLLGLSIIFVGLLSGVFLVLRQQIFYSQAAGLSIQNIILSNITEDSAVVSWQTNPSAASFITFGQNSTNEQTVLDDKDSSTPKAHLIHYVTLKNLQPKTTYQFKIIAGKITSDVKKFQTAAPPTAQTGFTPIIGSVLDNDAPVDEGIVYLSIADSITQSAPVRGGNFLIPLSYIRKTDLTDIYPLTEDTIAKLTIYAGSGEANMLFKLKPNSLPLPPIKLGQNIDLTTEETPSPAPINTLGKYDLNNDGVINSADYAILSSCLNKKPTTVLSGNQSCSKADLNQDGLIDKKDQDLMSQRP